MAQVRQTKKQSDIFVKVYDLQNDFKETMFTDQTGKFSTRSSQGHQYIMVLVEVDSSAILVAAMKSRKGGDD